MSTKIYEAWRWKRTLGMSSILFEVETIMKKQMYEKAQKLVEEMMKDEPSGMALHTLTQMCARLTQFQALNPYKGPVGDFSCDFCVWDWKQHFYMYPIGTLNNWQYADIYKIPGVEDFRYWNNTDEPEGMSRREWNRRMRVWDAQHDEKNPVTKTIFHILDPYSPGMELTPLFDPRWATDSEMARYGLPTCMRNAQREAQKKRETQKPKLRRVRCKLCKNLVPRETAHRHQGGWIGDDCCWDERLRSSE